MKRHQIYLTASLFIVMIAFAFTRKHPETKAIVAAPGFALVELYTSEGCSSCPPADKLVAKIAQEYKDKEVYVLTYHVDYWNRLGWKDVFSDPAYSARQRAYSGYLNGDGVYTPQAIVNGKTEFVGSDEGKMRSAVQQSLSKNASADLELSDVKISGNKLSLQYAVKAADNSSLLLAVIQKHAITQVKNGENSGRTLPHINIVQTLRTVNLKSNTGNAAINLPDGFNVKDWALVAFVQSNNNGAILAVQKAIFDKQTI